MSVVLGLSVGSAEFFDLSVRWVDDLVFISLSVTVQFCFNMITEGTRINLGLVVGIRDADVIIGVNVVKFKYVSMVFEHAVSFMVMLVRQHGHNVQVLFSH